MAIRENDRLPPNKLLKVVLPLRARGAPTHMIPSEKTLYLIGQRVKSNPITATKIAEEIGVGELGERVRGPMIRKIIHDLRRRGYPICANGRGYFYAKNTGELSSYINQLTMRLNNTQEALDGLQKSWGRAGTIPSVVHENKPVPVAPYSERFAGTLFPMRELEPSKPKKRWYH